MNTHGFSLIELVITLVVIGILAAFAVPLWPGNSINVPAQAAQIASDILYVQFLSATTGTRYNFVKISSTTYQIQNSSGTAIIYPGTGNTTVTLNSGITFGTFTNLPNNLVAFDGKGTPYTTITIPGTKLASQATIPISATSTSSSILISPTTGWVQVQ